MNAPLNAAALRSINALKVALKKLPITATARIAARAAPTMSGLAGDAYDSGQTVYGTARPQSVNGGSLSLKKSGASRTAMAFIATGRDIRTRILPKYTKYLIGKYDVLPNGPLPAKWRETLTDLAARVLYDEIHAGESKAG